MKIEDRVRATLVARADAVDGRATETAFNVRQLREASREAGSVGRWTRRRAATIVTAAAVFLAAGFFAWSAFMQTVPDATSSSPVASLSPATCQYGPWAELCPEADWVRHILREAGIPPIGNTGSAIIARSGGEFYVWTTNVDEEGPISKLVSDGFEPVRSVGDTAIYSDGVRFVWNVGSLYVWLQSGEQGFTIKPDLVATLVKSSQRTPESATTQILDLRFRIQQATYAIAADEASVQRDLERLRPARQSGDMAKVAAIHAHLDLARAALSEAEAHVQHLTYRLNLLLTQTASP